MATLGGAQVNDPRAGVSVTSTGLASAARLSHAFEFVRSAIIDFASPISLPFFHTRRLFSVFAP